MNVDDNLSGDGNFATNHVNDFTVDTHNLPYDVANVPTDCTRIGQSSFGTSS
jgi:hypothetical protein